METTHKNTRALQACPFVAREMRVALRGFHKGKASLSSQIPTERSVDVLVGFEFLLNSYCNPSECSYQTVQI